MPTGIAIRDARQQLFDAAERILLRDGPHALTSRAVTTEAGCAKGVLHRHFADFDAFLYEFVEDRVARVGDQAAALRESAGTGTVVGNVTDALTTLFGSVALAIISLVIFRDDLRARLRQARPVGVPVLTEATAMIASYLAAERDLGRIAVGADVDTLAPCSSAPAICSSPRAKDAPTMSTGSWPPSWDTSTASGRSVAPRVLWIEAEHRAGAVDREQGFVLSDGRVSDDIRVHLPQEVGRGPVHDGVGGSDDLVDRPGRGRLEREPARLRRVPHIDVAPQVPPAQPGSPSQVGTRA